MNNVIHLEFTGASMSLHRNNSKNTADSTLIIVSNAGDEKSVLVNDFGVANVQARNFVVAGENPKPVSVFSLFKVFAGSLNAIGWTFAFAIFAFSVLNVSGFIKSQVVLTGSMSPAINPGDLVISTSPDRIKPKIGDVVVYSGKRFDGTKVASFAHRIIGGNASSGFVVKGDNNPDADTQKPVLTDIEGVVLLTIPFVGKLLNPQIFILLMLAAFGLWLIFDAFRNEE